MIKNQSSHITLNNLSEGLEIQISTKRNILPIIFLGCWSVGWAIGEYSVIQILLAPPFTLSKLPLIIWLATWSIVGVFVICIWLWHANGKEVIRIDAYNLNHRRSFGFFSRSHNYAVEKINNLHVASQSLSMFKFKTGLRYWGLSGGIIEFNFNGQSYRFASDISKVEAETIIKQIKIRYINL